MITNCRSVSVAPGMLSAAMAFANEVKALVKAIAGVDLQVAVPVGGKAARLAWIGNFESLADYEAKMSKLFADPKYLEQIKKGAGIFVPDTLQDDIWRTI